MWAACVFVAGGSGVLGRRLVPQLVARGHRVTATTTGPGKLGLLEDLGAHGVVLDGLDGVPVGEAVATVRPDAIVHVMTALSSAHAGAPDVRHMDQWFGPTNRLRTEGTDNLLAAAAAADVRHVVAQSHANWNGIRGGGWVKIEDDPLDMHEGTVQNAVSVSIRHLETWCSRPGERCCDMALYGAASDEMVETVRKRQLPWSDRAMAVGHGCIWTMRREPPYWPWSSRRGVCATVVDDEPAPVKDWLPYLAVCVGAKPPRRISTWLARMLAGTCR
jgi:hypothetical protein